MSCHNWIKMKFNAFWTVLLGITFICCSLIIYYSLHNYGQQCFSASGCSSPSLKLPVKLKRENCKSICSSEDCVKIASVLMNNMNQDEDPCENFHAYSCGNFPEKYGPESNHSLFSLLDEDLYRILRDIIETSKETQNPEGVEQKLKTVYDSCMDIGSSDLTDFQELQSFIRELVARNWPYLNSNFSFSNPSLEDVLGKLLTFDENVFVKLYRKPDINETEASEELYVFIVDIPRRTYYNSTEEDLKDIVTAILDYAGMEYEEINYVWKSFLSIEKLLSELNDLNTNKSESGDCETWNKLDAENLYCNTNVSSENMLCRILSSVVKHGDLSSRYTNEKLSVPCSVAYYVQGLSDFLNSHNNRDLAHYIALRVFLRNLQYMNFFFRKKLDKFMDHHEAFFGDEDIRIHLDKWKFCVNYIEKNIKMPMGLMYVTEMFTQEIMDELDGMVQEYKDRMIEYIFAENSISENSSSSLIKTVEEIRNGVTENIKFFQNRTEITNAYKNFHPVKHNFFLNIMLQRKREFSSWHLDNHRLEILAQNWRMKQIFSTNAVSGVNIQLYFGILLPGRYKYGYPKLINTATLGEVIGHEIGHDIYFGFRDEVRKDNFTRLYVEENFKCREIQYSNFELKRIGKTVKGNETENENFSDTLGFQVTESIAKELLLNMTERPFALPGLDFTPEEIFYLSYAQVYCDDMSTEKELLTWEHDGHSPNEFRATGTLQSSQRFPQVFNCPTNSFMNPQKKCPVFS